MKADPSRLTIRFRPSLPADWQDMRAAIGTQSVMVNANVVAAAGDGLHAQLVHHPDFRIDPVTHRLRSDRGWTIGKNGLKRNYETLLREYGKRLPFALGSVRADWRRRSLTTRQHFVEDVLQFQLNFLVPHSIQQMSFVGAPTPELEKALRPGALLVPYDGIAVDEDLADQKAIWEVTPPAFGGVPTELVLALHPRALDRIPFLQSVVTEVLTTAPSVVWIWIPNLRPRPTRFGARRLQNLQSVVQRLAEAKRLRFLYGNFTEMLFAFDGVEEVACGGSIGTSGLTSKDGYGRLGLFYATTVHSLIHYPEARRAVARCRTAHDLEQELCGCQLCRAVFSRGGAAAFMRFFLSGTPIVGKTGSPSSIVERPASQSDHANKIHAYVARTYERDLVRATSIKTMQTQLQSHAAQLTAPYERVLWTLSTLG